MSLSERLVRYHELVPCTNAFIDTRSPGSDKKENFTIIGPGVSENPAQHIHIPVPHGFNIGGARQPPRCLNSQHSHLTEEVFIVFSGTWAFRTGVEGEDGEIILHEGDVISIPTNVFRGFENVGETEGFLFAILGGDDPGRVLWAPQVFEMAKAYGLVLLENGALVDTTLGQQVPDNILPMPVTTQAQVSAMKKFDSEELRSIVVRVSDFAWTKQSSLASFDGVKEAAIIGEASSQEGLTAGPLSWPHGFVLRVLALAPQSQIPPHTRDEEEVLFVYKGTVVIQVDNQTVTLEAGDTFTTPIGSERSFCNMSESSAVIYVTRRGNTPSAPRFR